MQSIKACFKNATLLFCFAIMLLAVSAGAQARLPQTALPAQSNSDVCPGTRVDLTTVAFTPFIRLSVAGKEGWFLIDSGSSYSAIDSSVVGGTALNQFVKLGMTGFPYVESEQFRVADLSSLPSPRGEGAMGIIGENILSLVSVQFQYDTDSAHIVVLPNACSPYLENNPDFAEINETGYYVRDRLHLNPGEPNIPHLGVKVGTILAPVYLDSGNADGGRTRSIGSIMMNSAFIDALNEAHVQIDPKEVYTAVACPTAFHHLMRTQTRWKVRGESLEITNRHEDVLKQYGEPTIDSIPPECSGIFSNPGPFGLIGASYFYRWGTVVLDAPGERVWIRKGVDKDVSMLPRYDTDWRPESGTGTYVSPYGERYDGDFLNGQFEGQGELWYANHDYYKGSFHNSLPEGQGELTKTNGDFYKGNFHNGQLDGQVEMWFANHDYYKGNFHNGLQEGRGVYVWANGDRYEGEFQRGLPEGSGVLTLHSGSRYEGAFHNGQPEGRGIFILQDRTRYEGEFSVGLQNGQGVITWANGDRYFGQWVNWKPNGYGTYIRASDGYRFQGRFHDGVFMGTN